MSQNLSRPIPDRLIERELIMAVAATSSEKQRVIGIAGEAQSLLKMAA